MGHAWHQQLKIHEDGPCRWRIPPVGPMRVPGRIYASRRLMEGIRGDPCVQQVANVACLPGIVGYSLAMPDIHWGYGFPIGGVAAFDAEDGVVSPGGVGYDINCGVRLIGTGLDWEDCRNEIPRLVRELHRKIPAGVGREGSTRLSLHDLDALQVDGARWAARQGFGSKADLDYIEERGRMGGADLEAVSRRARERGLRQLGSLGSGNHFLEIQRVAEVFDVAVADRLGLRKGSIAVTIHTGSRGFGYQVCSDALAEMAKSPDLVSVPDRQLVSAPLGSSIGRRYMGAMACAVNFAFANRQVLSHVARQVFEKTLRVGPRELGWHVIYEVAHNIAKMETHQFEGAERQLCVHRKGATRAFPAGRRELPKTYRDLGQPVVIPGDMGRASYVLLGARASLEETWGSSCHGAGRVLSRSQAKRDARGRDLVSELAACGVTVAATGRGTLAEEMPEAYKDVGEVVSAVSAAGISTLVVRLKPLGVIKG